MPPAIRIPEGVIEVIGRRLNLLSSGTNEVLALASVIGRDFSGEVLARAAAPLDEDALLEALDEAVAAHVLDETAPGQYRFTHNLIRMTLYDELRIARRRQYHRAVGNVIEALYRADLDPHLPQLVRHFQAAGGDAESERAIDYAVRAGRRADALLAFEDAAQSFELPSTPWSGTAARIERSAADCCSNLARRAASRAISRGRGQPCWRQPKPRTNLASSMSWCARQSPMSWRCGAFPTPLTGRFRGSSWSGCYARCRRPRPPCGCRWRVRWPGRCSTPARKRRREYRGRAQSRSPAELGDPAILATTLSYYLSDFVWGPDRVEEALDIANETLAAANACGNLEIAHTAHALRFQFELRLGDIAAADAEVEALMRLDQRIRQRTYSNAALAYDATLAIMRGRLDQAERDSSSHSNAVAADRTGGAAGHPDVYAASRAGPAGRAGGRSCRAVRSRADGDHHLASWPGRCSTWKSARLEDARARIPGTGCA